MATPFEDFLRLQGFAPLPPPRATAPPAPPFAQSPYLTPQMRGETGLPFGPLLGTELPPDLGLPATAPVESAPPARESAFAPTPGSFANGFSPASLALPRRIERGRGPFDDFMATYNLGRTPPAADPFAGLMPQQEQEQTPFFLAAQPGPVRGLGGQGANGAALDPAQMQREAMLARRFPRAMARVQQLRQMSQRRGY